MTSLNTKHAMQRFGIFLLLFSVIPILALAEPPPPDAESPTVEADPVTPQSNQETSPEIWSRPEPGRSRQESLPTDPETMYRNLGPLPTPPPEPRSQHHGLPATEFGVTLGPPAILNINLGYWGSNDFPFLARISGMYYGTTRGAQLDLGYILENDRHLRQYVALSVITLQTTTDYAFRSNDATSNYQDVFTGVGPTYGMNWNGLSLQVGVAMGQDKNTQSYSGAYVPTPSGGYVYNPAGSNTVNQFGPELTFQIGYTVLW